MPSTASEDPFLGSEGPPSEVVTFRHNPLHDAESIWWMAVYLIATRVVDKPDPQWDASEQMKQLDKPFPRSFRTSIRRDFFQQSTELRNVFRSLEPRLVVAYPYLNELRKIISAAFRDSQNGLPDIGIDQSVWDLKGSLHDTMKILIGYLIARAWPCVTNWSADTVKKYGKKNQ